jgi:hypothetical protein
MRSKAIGAAVGILLLILSFLSGGCARDNISERRDPSFLPYADAKVGQVSLREFLNARTAMAFEGGQLSVTISGADHFSVDGKGGGGMGLAAAIDRRGYFLTAAHCVEHRTCLLVFKDKGQFQAQTAQVVWRGDESKKEPDLALLRVHFPLQDVFEWTPAFTNGEPIVAAGMSVLDNHIKSQCMAGKILRLDAGSETVLPHHICISHDAPLHPGDSGGPLASTDGHLVGINCDAVIGRPRWLSFSVETLSSDAERPNLEWLRQLIQQDAAAQSGAKTNEFNRGAERGGMEPGS